MCTATVMTKQCTNGPCARRQKTTKVGEQQGCQGRTIECPYMANHKTGWGFDGNPLGSDAKPEAMPEGSVELK